MDVILYSLHSYTEVKMEPDVSSTPEQRIGSPLISVIVLNYNGAPWLEKCVQSLQGQTIFSEIELLIVDNGSRDGSDELAAKLVDACPRGKFIPARTNLGFCEGNNFGAQLAKGTYLFFLNNDTWLESDCLEVLIREMERMKADFGTPLMLNYNDNSIQSSGGAGFDIFGLMSLAPRKVGKTREMFVAGGCSFMINRELFRKLGGFDSKFFMYADEYDLSWRAWVTGARGVLVPAARLHHRGAANVNPAGGDQIVEMRTSDSKRYYTNRNCLVMPLKNSEDLLLLIFPLQVALLMVEALVAILVFRRWSFIRRAYIDAFIGCWRLRTHIRYERLHLRNLRRRTDWQMLRFLRFRLNRWDELLSMLRHGPPKVMAK